MSGNPRLFPQAARLALNDARLQRALGRLEAGFQGKRAQAFAALPDADGLRAAGAAARDYALSRLDELLTQFEENVAAKGGQVHWARDAAEARAIVTRILHGVAATVVTKGKSMVSEEIGLNAHLEAAGIVPIETDLGEYIVQLRREPPSHIIAPAFHLTRSHVAGTFRRAHRHLDPARQLDDRRALVAEARHTLRARFRQADAGVTGANFLVAETGSAVIVTNEGNGDLTRLLPRTHIVLAGIEKIVATLADAAVLLRLLTRSATGQEISAYVTFANGPRRTGDADGPEEFHVVLLDNGRSALLGSPAREVLRCIRCGACLNHCPVYGAIGGHAYGSVYPGPIGAALEPGLQGIAAAHHLPNASSFCGRCDSICPVNIPLTRVMRHWRNVEFAQGVSPWATRLSLRAWAWFARRPALYGAAGAIIARLLRLAAGKATRLSSLPFFAGWFAGRDLPVPSKRSFQTRWRKGERA
ncbi:MAG: lactate utilization protein B [Alphaproteobacteria bacterium]